MKQKVEMVALVLPRFYGEDGLPTCRIGAKEKECFYMVCRINEATGKEEIACVLACADEVLERREGLLVTPLGEGHCPMWDQRLCHPVDDDMRTPGDDGKLITN